jgi:ribosomal protein S18 acetylase RimI-like enzyme
MQAQAIILRPALPADAGGLARVGVETWRTTYKGIMSDETLAMLSVETRAQGWLGRLDVPDPQSFAFLLETNGEVIGFSSGGAERDGDPSYRGEIYALYLLQEYQHQGLGRRLVEASVRSLLENGMTSMLIWVLRDNPSRRFYESLGGKYLRERTIDIQGQTLPEVAYGWDDLRAFIKKYA